MQFTLSVLTTLAFAAGSMAHLKMKTPPQWGMDSPFSNAPLAAEGTDFPCQNFHKELDQTNHPEPVATYTAGGKGSLEILGGATHGGGSGQMVITYDWPLTPETEWKVIQSWEGDHPVKADGNTSGDSEQPHDPIEFAIPSFLEPGKATIAWNWFNRVGNREWYMKCAPVEIVGGSGSKVKRAEGQYSSYNDLPAMFRANIPSLSGSCRIPDSVSVIDFGDAAGPNVVVAPGATPERVDGCTVGSSTGGSTGGSTGTTPEAPASSSAAPAAPTSVPEEDDNSESGSGESEELPSQPTQPTQPVTSPSPIAQPDNSNKETSGSSGSCVEGTTICSEGNTWSQCGSGIMQNMGQVPAGLTCSNGKLIAKRSIRFSTEHRRHRARHV